MASLTGKMTAAEYRQMEEGPPWFQLIEGELVQDPSPNVPHQVISGDLFYLLENHCRKFSLGQVFFAPLDVWLTDDTVLQPDILFISNERRKIVVEGRVLGAPDLVVEILSPSSGRRDLIQKRAIYARQGVKEYWVVDPAERQMRIVRFSEAGSNSDQIVSESQAFGSPLFPGLTVPVAAVFQNV